MNKEQKTVKQPKMDPVALIELSTLVGELQGRVNVLRTLQDTHQRPGSMALVVSAVERSIERLRNLRNECEVLL